jgi:hypothetical protein
MSLSARSSVPLSLRVRGIPKSPTLEIHERCTALAAAGIRLGAKRSALARYCVRGQQQVGRWRAEIR